MPYIIPGVIAIPVRELADHAGHHLTYLTSPNRIRCVVCESTIEQERESNSLPCGCSTQQEHDEGVQLQQEFRERGRIPTEACVGCWLGDDAPSMHTCLVHR